MYKNIIYLTGDNDFSIQEEVIRWGQVFVEKYGTENKESIALGKKEAPQELVGKIFTTGLFHEKRLFIIRGGYEGREKIAPHKLDEILEKSAKDIPEGHFLLFFALGEKEGALISWLEKNADTKKHNTLWQNNYWEKRFPLVERAIIEKIILTYKGSSKKDSQNISHQIAGTLELLSLSEDKKSYEHLISVDAVFGDFEISNALLEKNIDKALRLIKQELSKIESQKVLISLISQLRNTLYIKYLTKKGLKSTDIAKLLTVHPYVLSKTIESVLKYEEVALIFEKLVSLDRAYKSGLGIKDSELGKGLSIERIIFELKNNNFIYNS